MNTIDKVNKRADKIRVPRTSFEIKVNGNMKLEKKSLFHWRLLK